MINLSLKPSHFSKHATGAATLIFTVVLLFVATLIILFAANFGMLQQKSVGNLAQKKQAFWAANAGLEYGVSYLKQNYATIIAVPVSGFINFTNASLTNVTLANGSKFSITFTNPTANNFAVIKITSTGVSSDTTSTRIISQLVNQGSILSSPASSTLVTQGNITMTGSTILTNVNTNQNIQSGGTVAFSGNAATMTSGGLSSDKSHIGSDITQNSTTLQNMSQGDFFATYFGNSMTAVKNQSVHYYSNSSNASYNTLDGMTGTSIWIDQANGSTASISGTTTIGSAANPVLLVVNGNLSVSGNVTIYGYVFVIGSNTLDNFTGSLEIHGGIATTGNLNITGNVNLTYDPTVLNTLKYSPSLVFFAKIGGSWKDF